VRISLTVELTRPTKGDSEPRKPSVNPVASAQPEPLPVHSKRPLNNPGPSPPTRSPSGLGTLNIGTPRGCEDVPMQDVSDDSLVTADQPRKGAAIGDGVSSGSASPPPRRSKARPPSAPYCSMSSTDVRRQDLFDITRRQNPNGQLWTSD
jgi:hypothetical protein